MERRQIRELIGRFLHNDVPGELQTQFRRWMLQPGDGDEKEAALREEWTAVVESPAAADRSEELQRLRHTIRMREAQQRRSRIFRRIRYAAAAAAVLLLVRKANQTGAPLCAELIYGDSNTRLTFPLEKDADYDVDTGYLTVHIKIQDGAARFVDSPCPDHICESFGWLSEEDQMATCLPARAVLSIIPTT